MKKRNFLNFCLSFLFFTGMFLPNSFAQCPTFNSCYELVSSDGCTHTFNITITGDNVFSNTTTPLLLEAFTFNFGINGSQDGTVISSGFVDPNGFLATNTDMTVSHTNSSVAVNAGNDDIDAFQLVGSQFQFTVEGNVNSCFEVRRSGINAIANFASGMGVCFVTGDCDETEVCSQGTEVTGTVTAPGFIYDCTETENHGIEGAEISITGSNGEVCETTTANDGTYSCTLCDGGPHEVCVTTTCDDACGVTAFDLILLRRLILGIDLFDFDSQIIGDVNLSGGASTLDLVFMQREILGFDDDNFVESWCRFIPVNDYGGNIGDIDNCQTAAAFGGTDFLRYMLGDMDGSCSDCIHGDEMGPVPIIFENDKKTNSTVIRSPSTDKLHVLTLMMDVPSTMEITKVTSSLPGLEYSVNDGQLQIIWIDTKEKDEGLAVAKNGSLIEIFSEGEGNLKLVKGENFWLGTETGTLRITERIEKRSNDSVENQDLLINQNSLIQISEIIGNGSLEVYNTAGALINKSTIDKSTSTINLDVKAGIYILYITDDAGTQTKKVFIN